MAEDLERRTVVANYTTLGREPQVSIMRLQDLMDAALGQSLPGRPTLMLQWCGRLRATMLDGHARQDSHHGCEREPFVEEVQHVMRNDVTLTGCFALCNYLLFDGPPPFDGYESHSFGRRQQLALVLIVSKSQQSQFAGFKILSRQDCQGDNRLSMA